MTETIFNTIYDFIYEMSPDFEMCVDYLSSQGVTITDDIISVINDVIWNHNNTDTPLFDEFYGG